MHTCEAWARKIAEERDGHHHFFIFDPESVFQLVQVLGNYQSFRLAYFDLRSTEVHVAMREGDAA